MTPILLGRWQTRSFLIFFVGIPITLLFGIAIHDMMTPLAILGTVYLQGLVLDVIYNLIQKRRWEQDWSPLLFTATGILEAVILFILIRMDYLPLVSADLPLHLFIIHYSAVWFTMFVFAWAGMKIIFPWWRFSGGRVIVK